MREYFHKEIYSWSNVSNDKYKYKTDLNFLFQNKNRVYWPTILTRIQLSEEFIEKVGYHLLERDWENVGQFQRTLSRDFIRKHIDKMGWFFTIIYQKHADEDLVREFQDTFDEWYNLPKHKTLSEEFMREFKDKLDWKYRISQYQNLSESFIYEFSDRLDWTTVFKFQHRTLCFGFLFKNKHRVDMKELCEEQVFPQSKPHPCQNKNCVSYPNLNAYTSTEWAIIAFNAFIILSFII